MVPNSGVSAIAGSSMHESVSKTNHEIKNKKFAADDGIFEKNTSNLTRSHLVNLSSLINLFIACVKSGIKNYIGRLRMSSLFGETRHGLDGGSRSFTSYELKLCCVKRIHLALILPYSPRAVASFLCSPLRFIGWPL
jgi:hypothetical protein